MPTIIHTLVTTIAFSFLLGSTPLLAESAVKFSDSSVTIKAPNDNWAQQPIRYKKDENADLKISLDQQQYPYLQPLIAQFAIERNKTIVVEDGTCGISAGKLRRKEVDMAGFCCPPSKLDRLPGLTFHTLGIASLALIANKDVGVNSMTKEQASKIFKGELTSWDEVSNNKADVLPISPITRPHCTKRPGHWRLIVPNKTDFTRHKIQVGSIPDMLKRTSQNSGAIGYETLWMVDQFATKEPVKLISIEGYNPQDQDALAKGHYPFYRTFSVTTWSDDAKPLASELIQFLIKNINSTPGGKHTMVGTDQLKKHGWKFNDDELIGEPNDSLYGRRED